jgi:hypothetical protein
VVGVFDMAASTFVLAPAAIAGDDDNFFTHLHTEKAMANVTVSPGHAGPVEITVQLETTRIAFDCKGRVCDALRRQICNRCSKRVIAVTTGGTSVRRCCRVAGCLGLGFPFPIRTRSMLSRPPDQMSIP